MEKEKMKTNLTKFAVIIFCMLLVSLAVTAEDKKPAAKIGENVLMYQPVHVTGHTLRDMMKAVLGHGKEGTVDYNEELNLLIIRAPKDSHPIILNMLKKYDVPPTKVLIQTYILQSGPGVKPDPAVDKLMAKAFDDVESVKRGANFEIVSSSSRMISLSGKRSGAHWTVSNDKGNETYDIYFEKVRASGKTVIIGNFMIRKTTTPKNGAHKTKILIDSGLSVEFGKPVAIMRGSSGGEALIIILSIEKK